MMVMLLKAVLMVPMLTLGNSCLCLSRSLRRRGGGAKWQRRHGEGGREEKRHHRSERHLRREAIDPSPPPPPPPEQPEQPKQAAPTLGSNIVNLPSTAADCVDCATAQAQAAHIQALPNGQPGMEVIESINPGYGGEGGRRSEGRREREGVESGYSTQ